MPEVSYRRDINNKDKYSEKYNKYYLLIIRIYIGIDSTGGVLRFVFQEDEAWNYIEQCEPTNRRLLIYKIPHHNITCISLMEENNIFITTNKK